MLHNKEGLEKKAQANLWISSFPLNNQLWKYKFR